MSTIIHNKTRYALGNMATGHTNITTSWQQINNGSITFECSGGRPVWVKLIKVNDGAFSSQTDELRLFFGQNAYDYVEYGFRLLVDGTVTRETLISDQLGVACSNHSKTYNFDIINFIVIPSAGSHTFSLETKVNTIPSGKTPAFYCLNNGYRLLVMEL